ncbi:MAG: hypothetical protein GXO32_08275 [Crenarchaeota archaeon]|nr:hypothetical protein [Thermoproteota archaeon]
MRSVKGKLVCPRCGFTRDASPKDLASMRKVIVFERRIEAKIITVGLPPGAILRSDVTCPRCGHKGVYYWRRQRSSAESSDLIERVWKCPSCGHEWVEIE